MAVLCFRVTQPSLDMTKQSKDLALFIVLLSEDDALIIAFAKLYDFAHVLGIYPATWECTPESHIILSKGC